jgi:hypothetical protein
MPYLLHSNFCSVRNKFILKSHKHILLLFLNINTIILFFIKKDPKRHRLTLRKNNNMKRKKIRIAFRILLFIFIQSSISNPNPHITLGFQLFHTSTSLFITNSTSSPSINYSPNPTMQQNLTIPP